MHHRAYFFLIAALAAFPAGCTSTTNVKEVETSVETTSATRRITLGKGDRISIKVDAAGASTITVTIARRKPNEGTYTTTSEVLVGAARNAQNALNKPGSTVWILVDEQNRITSIGHKQVL